MLAIDTNVLVRFLIDDDPVQAAKARALVDSEQVLLLSTVLLEAEWVLRSGYDLEKARVLKALLAFVGLPTVTLQEPDRVARALDWAMAGMDFADALHIAGAADCEAFVTFDRKISAVAGRLGAVTVRTP